LAGLEVALVIVLRICCALALGDVASLRAGAENSTLRIAILRCRLLSRLWVTPAASGDRQGSRRKIRGGASTNRSVSPALECISTPRPPMTRTELNRQYSVRIVVGLLAQGLECGAELR
jgi:hypothetical protein